MEQLGNTLNHYSVRLFFMCSISSITSTVKGMKCMYVCMYEYIVTFIHTYMHVKYIKMEKVMELREQMALKHTG